MKKVLAIMLAVLMVFSFAACNKDKDDASNKPSEAPVNKEELKKGWQEGVLTFANGKDISLPCTIDEIVQVSELSIPSLETMKNTELKPGQKKTLNLTGGEISVSIKCENTTDAPIKVAEATVIGYTFNRTRAENVKIKFANTLTVNAKKADVEDVLGVDERAADKGFSEYKGTNQKKQDVEMRVTYDSYGLVNSVAFEIK